MSEIEPLLIPIDLSYSVYFRVWVEWGSDQWGWAIVNRALRWRDPTINLINNWGSKCRKGKYIIDTENSPYFCYSFKILLKAHSQLWDNFWQLKAFKSDEICFLFHLKSSFLSQDIQVCLAFSFSRYSSLSCLFCHVSKRLE